MDKTENRGSIFIGDKPFSNYVNGAVMQFNQGTDIKILARGKFTSKAIDVAEVLRNKYLKDKVKLDKIEISTSVHKTEEGKEINISNIEIYLKRVK